VFSGGSDDSGVIVIYRSYSPVLNGRKLVLKLEVMIGDVGKFAS
jgi:hypothetical protein